MSHFFEKEQPSTKTSFTRAALAVSQLLGVSLILSTATAFTILLFGGLPLTKIVKISPSGVEAPVLNERFFHAFNPAFLTLAGMGLIAYCYHAVSVPSLLYPDIGKQLRWKSGLSYVTGGVLFTIFLPSVIFHATGTSVSFYTLRSLPLFFMAVATGVYLDKRVRAKFLARKVAENVSYSSDEAKRGVELYLHGKMPATSVVEKASRDAHRGSLVITLIFGLTYCTALLPLYEVMSDMWRVVYVAVLHCAFSEFMLFRLRSSAKVSVQRYLDRFETSDDV